MKLFTGLRREVGHGGNVPAGYQLAWYEPQRRIGVYFPVPLHWALRALRELRHRLQLALRAPRIERSEVFQMQRAHRQRELLAEEYARGYISGWRECFDVCLDAVEEEIERVDEAWDVGSLFPAPKPPRSN
jgi:hypothetical protein